MIRRQGSLFKEPAAPAATPAPTPEPKARPPLHHVHMALSSGPGGGRAFDLAEVRWRPENAGGDTDVRAVAHRIAFTWNMAEGIPTDALEAGVVRRFYDAAIALKDAAASTPALKALCDELQAALDAHAFDYGPGCKACGTASEADGDPDEPGVGDEGGGL